MVKIIYHDRIVVGGEECTGCFDPKTREIWLQKGMPPAKRREVFLHEFMEMVTEIYSMDICHENLVHIGFAFSQLFANHKIDLNE